MAIKSTAKLVEEFAACVVAQTEQIERGDSRLGNVYAKRYLRAFNDLRRRGDAGRDALAVLLDDPRMDVREMAAAFLLRHRYRQCRELLEEIASGPPSLFALGAAECLARWDEGSWQLDPPDG